MQVKDLIIQIVLQMRVISDKLTDLIDIHMCKPCLRSNTHTCTHTLHYCFLKMILPGGKKLKLFLPFFSLSTYLSALWCQWRIISIRNEKECKKNYQRTTLYKSCRMVKNHWQEFSPSTILLWKQTIMNEFSLLFDNS